MINAQVRRYLRFRISTNNCLYIQYQITIIDTSSTAIQGCIKGRQHGSRAAAAGKDMTTEHVIPLIQRIILVQ